jgi:DNA-binding transcriptional ArsR family regulator
MPSKQQAVKGSRKATKKQKVKDSPDLVDHALMQALSHRLRTRILVILNERPASPNQLSSELNEGLSQVSYHFTRLKKLGLIELCKEEPRRGAVEHFYRAVGRVLVPRDTWTSLPKALRSSLSVEIMGQSFEDADSSLKAGIFDDPDSYASWSPMVVDRQGMKRIDKLANKFLQEMFDVQAEANERLSKKGKEGFSLTVILASFLSTRSPEASKRVAATKQR